MKEATLHILNHTDRPLAFVGGRHASHDVGAPHHERYEGFLEAHRELGRAYDTDLFHTGRTLPGGGREAARIFLDRCPELGGIVCSDDILAHAVLDELEKRGIPVPGRVSVFGFGDCVYASESSISLSTVSLDVRTMGAKAVELMERRIRDPQGGPEIITVPGEMHYRQSTPPVLPVDTGLMGRSALTFR